MQTKDIGPKKASHGLRLQKQGKNHTNNTAVEKDGYRLESGDGPPPVPKRPATEYVRPWIGEQCINSVRLVQGPISGKSTGPEESKYMAAKSAITVLERVKFKGEARQVNRFISAIYRERQSMDRNGDGRT